MSPTLPPSPVGSAQIRDYMVDVELTSLQTVQYQYQLIRDIPLRLFILRRILLRHLPIITDSIPKQPLFDPLSSFAQRQDGLSGGAHFQADVSELPHCVCRLGMERNQQWEVVESVITKDRLLSSCKPLCDEAD